MNYSKLQIPLVAVLLGCLTGYAAEPAPAEMNDVAAVVAPESEESLAKASQNPVADLISLPIQNNFNFGVGPSNATQWVANIQPVIPLEISEDWNVINRAILPVITQDSIAPGVGSKFGLGDLNYTAFLSPSKSSKVTWGIGPVVTLPTATDDVLGTGKWSLGPSLVVLTMPGRWVVGSLVSNSWSVAGESDRDNVNFFLWQYFINYNFDGGWYAVSAPIMTADWNAASGDRWTIPVGGGFGRVFKIGSQPVNANLQAFYNVETPDNGAEWSIRFQFQWLFPK